MRYSLVVLLSILHVAMLYPLVQSPNIINWVNSQKKGWRAGVNPRFENTTTNMVGELLGTEPEDYIPEPTDNETVRVIVLPDEFDARGNTWHNLTK